MDEAGLRKGEYMMGDRIPPGSYFQYPPSGVPVSPHRSSPLPTDRERFVFSWITLINPNPFFFIIINFWKSCTLIIDGFSFIGLIILAFLVFTDLGF